MSVILVLQDPRLQKQIDTQLIKLWFSSYIGNYKFYLMHISTILSLDLLKRKQLWKEAAFIVKLCPLEEISSESQVCSCSCDYVICHRLPHPRHGDTTELH